MAASPGPPRRPLLRHHRHRPGARPRRHRPGGVGAARILVGGALLVARSRWPCARGARPRAWARGPVARRRRRRRRLPARVLRRRRRHRRRGRHDRRARLRARARPARSSGSCTAAARPRAGPPRPRSPAPAWRCSRSAGGGDAGVSPLGVALAVVAGGSYADYTLAAKRLLDDGHAPEAVMAVAFGLGAVVLAPVLVAQRPGLARARGGGLALALFLGVVPTALAYVLFARGLRGLQRLRDGDAHARRAADRRRARRRRARRAGDRRRRARAPALVLGGAGAARGCARAGAAARRRRPSAEPRLMLAAPVDRRRCSPPSCAARSSTARSPPARGCASASCASATASPATRCARRCGSSRPRGSCGSSRTAARRVARLGPEDVRWLYELRAALELEARAPRARAPRRPPARRACTRRSPRSRPPAPGHDPAWSEVNDAHAGAARRDRRRRREPAHRRRPRRAERRAAAVPARSCSRTWSPARWPPTTRRWSRRSSATGRRCCASTCANRPRRSGRRVP